MSFFLFLVCFSVVWANIWSLYFFTDIVRNLKKYLQLSAPWVTDSLCKCLVCLYLAPALIVGCGIETFTYLLRMNVYVFIKKLRVAAHSSNPLLNCWFLWNVLALKCLPVSKTRKVKMQITFVYDRVAFSQN